MIRFLASLVFLVSVSGLAQAQDGRFWVIVGYVDHPPMEWTDAVMVKAADLENRLAACGLRPFWDWTAKFVGFNPNGRGTVFVIDGAARPRAQAEMILALARPCVPDAYVKAGDYLGE
jgi:hypothetical protein